VPTFDELIDQVFVEYGARAADDAITWVEVREVTSTIKIRIATWFHRDVRPGDASPSRFKKMAVPCPERPSACSLS
jgi:hypothetical protein